MEEKMFPENNRRVTRQKKSPDPRRHRQPAIFGTGRKAKATATKISNTTSLTTASAPPTPKNLPPRW
jgi:hypothetical protein